MVSLGSRQAAEKDAIARYKLLGTNIESAHHTHGAFQRSLHVGESGLHQLVQLESLACQQPPRIQPISGAVDGASKACESAHVHASAAVMRVAVFVQTACTCVCVCVCARVGPSVSD